MNIFLPLFVFSGWPRIGLKYNFYYISSSNQQQKCLSLKSIIKTKIFLLPPSINEFLPTNHLATVIDEIVEQLDICRIEGRYSEKGQNSYHPKLLLKLLFYGYATGVRSGRKIASKCQTDLAFMYLACMYRPDFRTINDLIHSLWKIQPRSL
jgi:transposase